MKTKMKNKYVLPILLIGTVGLQGCSDFLDTEPTEGFPETTVWETQGTVDAFVIGNYGNAYGPYESFSTWDKTFSNNMVNCRAACPSEVRGLMENNYGWGLNDRFGAIRNCNLIIEKMESSTIPEAYKNQFTAEAKMMRAMIYYDLARKGGRYIWVDRVLTEKDEFNLPLTKDIVESYLHVLTDIREAIIGLPETAISGRLTKNAAYALLSEVCLTAAAYTNDAAALQKDGKSLYQEAIDAVNALKGVSLDPNYENMFNEKGAYSSPEIILAHYWSKDATDVSGTDMINLIPNLLNSNLTLNGCGPLFKIADIFECWLDHTPSQNLVDDYLVIDQTTGQAVRWDESSQFVNNTRPLSREEAIVKIEHKEESEFNGGKYFKAFEVTTPGMSISDLMYNHRDKRFDASIVHDGSVFLGENITTYTRGNMSRWATQRYASDHVPLTNYSMRKYIYTEWSPRPFYNVMTDYHKILFRYGRALLNKAEALLRLNKVSDAVAVLNQTRTIHGGLPASNASTLGDAWEDYKIERRVELFWEGDWYFSLLRWGKYGREANDGKEPGGVINELMEPATFIEIKTDRTAAYVGNVQLSNDDRKFDVRSYLFPITKSVIQANSAISDADQNPGWE